MIMSQHRGTILMIDEDTFPNQPYADRLEREGFKVEKCLTADDAIPKISRLGDELVLITLDIMMPSGHYSAEATDDGLNTGIEIYKEIRASWPRIPIICVTLRGGFSESDLGETAEADENLLVAHKLECKPRELSEMVEKLLSAHEVA